MEDKIKEQRCSSCGTIHNKYEVVEYTNDKGEVIAIEVECTLCNNKAFYGLEQD